VLLLRQVDGENSVDLKVRIKRELEKVSVTIQEDFLLSDCSRFRFGSTPGTRLGSCTDRCCSGQRRKASGSF